MQNFTTLIVEHDEPAGKVVASTLIDELNLTAIHQSVSGNSALEFLAHSGPIDCILSEIDLPDIQCFDFVNKAKEFESAKGCSVVLMSSRTDRETIITAAAAGADDFLVKPFSAGALVVKFKKLLAGDYHRASERIPVLDACQVHLQFVCGAEYDANLLDISKGGCMVESTAFDHGGGVLEQATLVIPAQNEPLIVKAELVRSERSAPSNKKVRTMKSAFQFVEMNDKTLVQIEKFIETLNKPLF
ncbi:MAG: response regulator [Gammaproteobacteria bacterium]|nr:response regulator [Gammaproteobacteria bacterium]